MSRADEEVELREAPTSVLNEEVHDIFWQMASELNRRGREAQISFILDHKYPRANGRRKKRARRTSRRSR